jgi:hypothetical protein
MGGNGKLLIGMGFIWGMIKCSKTDCGDGCITLNILKTIELHTLNELIKQ